MVEGCAGPAPTTAGATGKQSDAGRENVVLRELVTVYRHLSGLALQDAEVATVTELLAQRIGATVAVVGPTMEMLAASGPDVSAADAAEHIRGYVVHPRLSQVLSTTGQTRRALRLPEVTDSTSVIVAPVLVGDEVAAYLMTLDQDEQDRQGMDEDISLLVTEHAATICGVILGRERVVTTAARRVREDLVEGLLLGRGRDDDEVRRWAGHLGYDAAREHRVMSVTLAPQPDRGGSRGTGPPSDRVSSAVEHFFATQIPAAIMSSREAEVVVLVPTPPDGSDAPAPDQLGSACARRVEELFGPGWVTLGIGGPCREPAEIARSYAEACRTVDALGRLGGQAPQPGKQGLHGRHGQVAAFEDLGIHRLLLQVPDLAELWSFADGVLGKLRSYERDHRAGYLATLACYFRENGSPQRASRELFVHPNTVAYRIKRVEEITGLDFETYRDRLMAQVALEIVDALGDDL